MIEEGRICVLHDDFSMSEGNMAKTYKVSAIVEKDAEGYYAYSPELKGCQSQGSTFEEAFANIKEAIELYLETLTIEERRQLLSKDIHVSSVEVQLA